MTINKLNKLYTFACGMLMLIMFATGCRLLYDQADDIKIGVIVPLSGEYAIYGEKVLDGIKLAAWQINQKGGINGKTVELLVRDNQSLFDPTAKAMDELVDRKIVMVIGAYASENTLALKPGALKHKIPVLAPIATNDVVTERNPFMFRACFNDTFQARALARFIFERGSSPNLGIMVDVNEEGVYSRDLGRRVEVEYRELGGSVVKVVGYYRGDVIFTPQLRELIKANVQAIFVPAYAPEANRIIRQARKLGFTGDIFGCDGWDEPELLVPEMGNPGKCSFSTMFSVEYDTIQVKEFITTIKAVTERPPGVCEAQGYDAMNVAAAALTHDADNVKSGLYRIKNFPGVTGPISINAERNVVTNVFFNHIVGNAKKGFSVKLLKILEP